MQGQKYSELGSEFWLEDVQPENRTYVLSGRTAIDLILQDMQTCGRKAENVYMPAWCCDSMLQPFLDRGVKVRFYDMSYEENRLSYDINRDERADILYVNNYFGYNNTLSLEIIQLFKQRGAVILYDRTHSLFRDDVEYQEIADYTFASIRKWMGVICGAYLSKNDGGFTIPVLKDCPYLSDKEEAMRLKATYMEGNSQIDKQQFLNLYSSFGHHLAEDYLNYQMDDQSLSIWNYADKQALRKWRTSNALYLQVSLNDVQGVQTMFSITNSDCALFVPVLFETKELRDKVRKHLTDNSIYCPIHWPKPVLVDASMNVNDIYDRELSLLCDQRYNFEDMQRIIETIKEKKESIDI